MTKRRLEGPEGIQELGHRDYVGGFWDEIGKLQFEFLISRGLRPGHVLLDIACGALRGGVHYIAYLEPGHYMGLDKENELIRVGIEKELPPECYAQKRPEFLVNDKFEMESFSRTPDYAIAQSLFTHLVATDISLCLRNLYQKVAGRRHSFYATFFESTEIVDGELNCSHSHACFFYTKKQMIDLGRAAGWNVEYVGDWGHPRKQKMMHFFNL